MQVAIIGGGVAGLRAARMLHAAGIDFRLFEAGGRLGGRVLSAGPTGAFAAPGFDLGASWFWPGRQPALAALVAELKLATYPQHVRGDVIVERMSRETPQRYRPLDETSQSLRLVGGMGALVSGLAEGLPAASLCLNSPVTSLSLQETGVTLTVGGLSGPVAAEQVIAALPPRLLAATVSFTPALEDATAQRWCATDTWMAPHAKFFAFYDRAFWRDAGLSGTVQSFVGPLAEIHDATTLQGNAALMGFFGIGADQRASMGQAALAERCVAQLKRVFGAEAGRPGGTLIKDWARDELTATPDDRSAGMHPPATTATWVAGAWANRLVLAGSETSDTEPGFLAGAAEAGRRAAISTIGRLAGAGSRR